MIFDCNNDPEAARSLKIQAARHRSLLDDFYDLEEEAYDYDYDYNYGHGDYWLRLYFIHVTQGKGPSNNMAV